MPLYIGSRIYQYRQNNYKRQPSIFTCASTLGGPVPVDRDLPAFFSAVLKLCAILKLVEQDGNGVHVATMEKGVFEGGQGDV